MSDLIYQKKLRAYEDIFGLLTSNVLFTRSQIKYMKNLLFLLSIEMHTDHDLTGEIENFEIWLSNQITIQI